MGSLFGRKDAPKPSPPPRASKTLDQMVPPVSREVADRSRPMTAPEVDLKGKLPAPVAEALDPALGRGCRALLIDPEEEETRFFALFEDHLEELGRSPVAGHADLLALLDFCKGGAISLGPARYRLEAFKSFNEFGDRLTLQFFEEGTLDHEGFLERRQANIRLVNRLKPATALTARNELDLDAVVRRNPRERPFVDCLVEEGLLTPEQLQRVPGGEGFVLRVLQGHVFPRKMAASALAKYLGVEYVDVEAVSFSKEAARLLDKEWELRRQVVPFAQEGEVLRVAMMDPTDSALVAEIEQRTGLRVLASLSAAQDILAMTHKAHKRDD